MTLRWADRVAEYVSAPSGSAAFAIASSGSWQSTVTGLSGGWNTFANVPSIVTNDTLFYFAYDGSGNTEVGIGTYSSSGHTLTRTTILVSSNSNTACSFSGNVTVVNGVPAEYFMPTSIAAAGTTQGTATAIVSRTVFVISGTGGVILTFPQTTKVINVSGAVIDLYPMSGSAIDSAGTNNPVSIADGVSVTIEPLTATQLYST